MTTENFIPSVPRPTFGSNGIYTLTAGTKTTDAYEHLNTRITHLRAMLDTVYGGGYESFKEHNENTQENFLWSCASIARECEQLAEAMGSAIYKKLDTI